MTRSNPAPGFARNPSKVITIEAHDGEVTVSAGDVPIARSASAKILAETPYAPVFYIPFSDIDFGKLSKTDHSTHCPYKGDASYWSIEALGEAGRNTMWAYEAPFDEAIAIKDHGAFYPDKVTIRTA
ncbi:DUF427 domain-containing protein [Kumtagia ephedrae]|uniref:DUF427 domain-containing protein n=1 Tax=Kumtagia ephedrae TaxID=2116701 RepID=A0A2P7SIZ5_9HYPH|nr:DUF427 domain-containing protein [Mesorhizobium ephedrae]PSJ62472.1 hypothetical protein C7I84_07625 [Mesorhizobium ephedrae]